MKAIRLLWVPPALICLGLVRLLKRFGILIRFGEFYSWRIGHLAGNTECYLCERDDGRHQKSLDIWVHKGEICNKQLAKMIERVLWVDKTGLVNVMVLLNALFRGGERHYAQSAQLDRDIFNLYEKQPPHLKFTKREEEKGKRILRKWGIPENAKWVCLIVRDGAYLPGLPYHRYRDCDVQTFRLMAQELTKRGYIVFRMGAKVEKPFDLLPWVFDYATNGMRSDFMDVYLGAKCEFCVSTGTGFDSIPVVFRRPVCYVNYVPLEYLNTYVPNSLAIWKHHIKDGKRMSPSEIYQSGAGQFMTAEQFEEAGITLVDNSPEEIRDTVLEMADMQGAYVRIHNREPLTDNDGNQQRFWKSFPRSISPYNSKPLHGEIRMRIGAKFLSQYDQR